VAFAKLGSNPHTDGLVRNESRALALVEQNPVPGLSSPRVLHEATFNGHPLLVTAPLPSLVRRLTDRETPDALTAARSLARPGSEGSLAGSDHARALRARLSGDGS